MSLDFPNPLQTEEIHIDLGTANVPASTSELTITAWVNAEDGLAEDQVIIAKSVSTGNDGAFVMQLEEPDDELRGIINDDQLTGSIVTPDIWTFVAQVYDGSDQTLFINGVLDATQAQVAGDIDTNTDPLILAALNDGSVKREFDGLLADVRVYTRALSAAELLTMFTLLGKDNIVNGLLWRWFMRELSPGTAATVASSIIDFAGNLNGTPENSPVYQAGNLR